MTFTAQNFSPQCCKNIDWGGVGGVRNLRGVGDVGQKGEDGDNGNGDRQP
jgi:hypothetical protein